MAKASNPTEKLARLAIVSEDRCKPKKCAQECRKSCPVVRIGKECIAVAPASERASVSEILCNGCGICVKKCPFKAIKIVNLPGGLENEISHCYGDNSFRLHRLPIPRSGQVLGLVGANGTGKSTVLKILAGELKPNLGNYLNPPDWQDIIGRYHGSQLHTYLLAMLQSPRWTAVLKPQYVDLLARQWPRDKDNPLAPTVGRVLQEKANLGNLQDIIASMDLGHLLDRPVEQLSGGELQRLACALTCVQMAQVRLFDEPSSYLDVRQRLRVCRLIHSTQRQATREHDTATAPTTEDAVLSYTLVVEHDLAVLDSLSDYICILYGHPAAYGVVSRPIQVLKGINSFLDGYLASGNIRIREHALVFTPSDVRGAEQQTSGVTADLVDQVPYPAAHIQLSSQDGGAAFTLDVQQGAFKASHITVLLGENGTGKTTFLNWLSGKLPSSAHVAEEGSNSTGLGEWRQRKLPRVAYKVQQVNLKARARDRVVLRVLEDNIPGEVFADTFFQSEVIVPLQIKEFYDRQLSELSGGELQRMSLALCLGQPAEVYLIDEPSAYLDCEQRLICARVIKRFTLHKHRAAFVVEHDLLMANFLADQMIVFEGAAGRAAVARSPQTLLDGMNTFLHILDVTFRRDSKNFRPRVNRLGSARDLEQKKAGLYFFVES